LVIWFENKKNQEATVSFVATASMKKHAWRPQLNCNCSPAVMFGLSCLGIAIQTTRNQRYSMLV